MRLGYSMSYWGGAGLGPADHLTLVHEAERLGYGSVWAAETYGTDPAALMAWIAGRTERIGLGTGVLQMSGRKPVVAAMTAATIDLGKELSLGVFPVQARLPVYLAAMGPETTALAGELADGWLAIHFPPEHLAERTAQLRRGAERAGRSLDGFDVAPMVLTLVDEDEELAFDMMRPMLALYLGGMGSRRTNFYNRLARSLGSGKEAEAVQEAFLGGRQGEAMSLLPDALVDAMTMCGPAGKLRERVAAYREAGATSLIVGLVTPTLRLRLEQLELVAELAA
ncbi:alkanesulfonate monooxygenase SsuD/methylene tetrahydromethanopterin reductase-like flavin-dependent oxidoreductase (luciferase family) [Streptosporangium album]|uniref:Alkanesulfonate monooxygenase SsuD/methylene tetrahydromethanopterin reductase-like flavin-dependent oxidoreductase (Luciferase family) n=1 Tax=Streptosporangium album TaxID=47479 RepID=A0A7W7WBZ5_9ACTN|nr:LLM class flavin-dependent oxidoreductase [Streptosporangium album]MBB4941536.1 alkanesulfonate monooxygenase SsuD/methylene tetrahydromethanopterin reductase-like flavin-dependent oxidoreductase (luciferase family) [Streptosporangium album]